MPELDNAAIARRLELMGDLLEIAGADKFRFLSYRKAANAIRAWPEQLSVMAEEGRLTDVPGVGAKLAVAIERLLATGTFPELEDAMAAYPPGLVEVMQVPGVGAKRARQFFEKLGVDSVDALDRALDRGDVERLGGMGPKSAEAVRRGLATHLAHRGRMLLMDALPLAEHASEELARVPGVEQVEPAGSLRRREETIGDIDVLVSATDAEAVMAAVRELPFVAEVIASGATKTSVLTTAGPQVDVRVVAPAQFGAALQYFTGSREHNVHLREIAKRRGLKINEYGVFRLGADGAEERIGGATEDEVYAALGMATPPPELRTDTGEIDAAESATLPVLIELADICGDLHAHTTSTDAHSTLEENRAVAAELGYEYLAVTDHAYDLRMVRGMSVDELEEQWALVNALNAERGDLPYLLKGIELNIGADGSVDYDEDVLARFDFCVASLHSGFGDSAEKNTARLLAAMDNPFVDIIGHPTGRIIGRRDPVPLDVEAVLAAAGATGTIMEVNAYPDRLDLKDTHLRAARRHGVRFAISTDAHRAEHLRYMRYGVSMARRGWVSAAEVVNAQPLEGLLGSLKRNRRS